MTIQYPRAPRTRATHVIPVPPEPWQESVWDYPRPPRPEAVAERLRVVVGGRTIGDTTAGIRILETSHPPTYYLPPDDVDPTCLLQGSGRTVCEFKGEAVYWSIVVAGVRSDNAAWSYPQPTEPFRSIAGYLAFYPSRVEQCWVGEERVHAQDGDFYGGWITSRVVGPFKGGPGTWHW